MIMNSQRIADIERAKQARALKHTQDKIAARKIMGIPELRPYSELTPEERKRRCDQAAWDRVFMKEGRQVTRPFTTTDNNKIVGTFDSDLTGEVTIWRKKGDTTLYFAIEGHPDGKAWKCCVGGIFQGEAVKCTKYSPKYVKREAWNWFLDYQEMLILSRSDRVHI